MCHGTETPVENQDFTRAANAGGRFCSKDCGTARRSSVPNRWHRLVVRIGAYATVIAMAACTSLPDRESVSPEPVRGATAQQVQVRDRTGAVAPAEERRVLAAVKAEGDGELTEHHLRVLAASGEVDLYRGNSTKLLLDGPATFGAMKAAIERARGRVLLESYIVEDSKMADELSALLSRKVSQGVSVALMYDGVGSFTTDEKYFDNLSAAGVAVCKFNPVNPLERPGYWGINHRNHRKVLVVDEDVAFTGGINISRAYSSGSFGRPRAAATTTRCSNAAGATRTSSCAARWCAHSHAASAPCGHRKAARCTGRRQPRRPMPSRGNGWSRCSKAIRAIPPIASTPRCCRRSKPRDAASTSRWRTLRRAPTWSWHWPTAARRGVDVALVLPGRSDFTLVLHAGRSYYDELLSAGVRIHEMDEAVMHAKTAVIDGVFSTVGSSNMDWRSWVANNEINAIVLGSDFGKELEAVFQRDVAQSRPVQLDGWRERGLSKRMMEQIGRMAERLL